MADIYSLSVRADTSDIRRGRQDLDRFGNQAGSTRSTVTELGKSLVIFAAAATGTSVALGALAVNSIKAAKEVVGLARIANTTVPIFQNMAFASKSVGVETVQLSAIFKDMSDRVGDFITTGGGELADFFEKIAPQVGVTAEQFRELSGPDALQLFVSSLEKANVSQNEMIFFMEAMSSESTRLLPLLRDNGAAMAEQAKEAEALGIALSDVDAQNITDAAEQINAVGSVLSALSNQLAAEVSPLVSALSRQFLDLTEEAGGVDEVVSDLSESINVATNVAAALAIVVAGRMTAALTVSGAALAFNAVQAVRVQLALGRMAGASSAAAAGMLAMGVAARGASAAMSFLGGPVGIVLIAAASLYYFRDALFATNDEVSELHPELDNLTDSMNELSRAQLNSNRASIVSDLVEARSKAKELSDALAKAEDGVGRAYVSIAKDLRVELGNQNADVKALESVLADLDEQLKLVIDQEESLAESAAAAADAAAAAAAKTTAAMQLEMEFLRTQNALVEAGMEASRAELIIREQKLRLQLQGKGLTQAESVEYVALEKAIRGAMDAEQEQASINKEASGIAASMMSEEASIQASYERRRDIVLENTRITGQAQKNLLVQLETEKNEKINNLNAGFWDQYLDTAKENLMGFDDIAKASIDTFTRGMGDALESVIFDSENLNDALEGVAETILRNVVNSIGQMAAQWLALQAVQAVIGTATTAATVTQAGIAGAAWAPAAAMASLATLGANAVPAGAALTSTTGLATTLTAVAGAREMGGQVQPNSQYLVGERGPEIISMGNQPGHVTPNHQLDGGQPVSVTNVFQISTGVEQTVQAEIERYAPLIEERSRQGILKAINSGGAMSRATGRRA